MPKERQLTTQQRTAIAAVAGGSTYQEAGEKAGYSPNSARQVIGKMLTKNDKAKEYLAELREKTQSSKVLSIQRRQEILSQHAEQEGKKGAGASIMDAQRAIAELNKMTGAYTPEEINHKHSFFDNVPKENGLGRG